MTVTETLPSKGDASATPGVDNHPEVKVRPMWEQVILCFFVGGPTAMLFVAPLVLGLVCGLWPTLLDCILAIVFYAISAGGVTIGLHRYFTHGSFKAKRPLKLALGIAGSFAVQGPITRWVADHRKHHKFSDKEDDPHSPYRYGQGFWAMTRGFVWSHLWWLFDREQTSLKQFAPDLVEDPDVRQIDRWFPVWTVLTFALPALIGGLVTLSWVGALSAFIWAGVVRVAVVHHVTWSINSICHIWGKRPFKSRDDSRNVWWLSVFSLGESWHNLHHADQTCARHGVDRWQVDISARLIALFEHFGWAHDVRWPTKERLNAKRAN